MLDKLKGLCYNKDTKGEGNPTPQTNFKGDFTMYDYNITAQELSDYYADMAEMAGEATFLSDEEMEEMAKFFGES